MKQSEEKEMLQYDSIAEQRESKRDVRQGFEHQAAFILGIVSKLNFSLLLEDREAEMESDERSERVSC